MTSAFPSTAPIMMVPNMKPLTQMMANCSQWLCSSASTALPSISSCSLTIDSAAMVVVEETISTAVYAVGTAVDADESNNGVEDVDEEVEKAEEAADDNRLTKLDDDVVVAAGLASRFSGLDVCVNEPVLFGSVPEPNHGGDDAPCVVFAVVAVVCVSVNSSAAADDNVDNWCCNDGVVPADDSGTSASETFDCSGDDDDDANDNDAVADETKVGLANG